MYHIGKRNHRLRCSVLTKNLNYIKKYHFPLVFVISAVLLCIRAQYGYSFNDEPFIVSLAQRLSHGASLIVDEWNFGQNFGVILLPLYKLYIACFGSTEGILLAFRMVYCMLWSLTCTVIYWVLSRKFTGGFFVFCYLLLFSPLDQMTLSYTSISLMCCLAIAALFFYHLEIHQLSYPLFTTIFTVLSVIVAVSLPFLAFAYALVVLLSIGMYLAKKTEFTRFFVKVTLTSCVFAAGIAAVYLYYFVLRNYPLAVILENISNMFSSMAVAKAGSTSKFITYVQWLTTAYRTYEIVLLASILAAQLSPVRKLPELKALLFLVDAAFFALELYKQVQHRYDALFNYQMVPIVFLGIAAFFMLDSKKKYKMLFICFSVWGIFYSLFYHLSSDTSAMGISMGFSVAGVASIVYIVALYQEWKLYFYKKYQNYPFKKLLISVVAVAFSGIIAGQLVCQIILKTERHYWDVPLRYMTNTIEIGSAKGIKTDPSNKAMYEFETMSMQNLLANVDHVEKQQIKFLSLVSSPVLYLDADLPIGSFSSWTFMRDQELLVWKMNLYYSINPSQIPNVIFCRSDDDTIEKVAFDLSQYRQFTDGIYSLYVSNIFTSVS